jgi:hypothetical protein
VQNWTMPAAESDQDSGPQPLAPTPTASTARAPIPAQQQSGVGEDVGKAVGEDGSTGSGSLDLFAELPYRKPSASFTTLKNS